MPTEIVTRLKRQATEILNQLEKGREPILIMQHGVPSAYLVDVETFETLQRRMTLLEGIARGEKAIEEGRSFTHKQAKQRMSRWLK
jgi:prevent-host-death family protein